jgi:hypothetical protein
MLEGLVSDYGGQPFDITKRTAENPDAESFQPQQQQPMIDARRITATHRPISVPPPIAGF